MSSMALGLFAAVAALSLLASCADSGNDTTDEGAQQQTGQEEMAIEVADGSAIEDRLEAFREAEYVATYEFTSQISGEPLSGTFTWYRSDGAHRIDFDAEQDGEAFQAISIDTEEFAYFCSATEEECTRFKDGDAMPPLSDLTDEVVGPLWALKDPDDDSVDLAGSEERTIGGVSALCAEFSGAGEGDYVCFNDDAVPVAMEYTSGDLVTTLSLVESDSEVLPSDLDPPYPVDG